MPLMQKLDNSGKPIDGVTKFFSDSEYAALSRMRNVKWRLIEKTPPKISRQAPVVVSDAEYKTLSKTDKKQYIDNCSDVDKLTAIAESEKAAWLAIAAKNRIESLPKTK